MAEKTKVACTFCHKSEDDVVATLAFPNDLNICDECIVLMVDIVSADHHDWRDRLIDRLQGARNG